MNIHHPRVLTAVCLTLGVFLVISSGWTLSSATLLSGQGSTLVPEKNLSATLRTAPESSLHGAALDQSAATRQLIMGILFILLGLGIYTFYSIRNRDIHRPAKHTKRMTLVRASSRWFWID